LLSRTTTSQPPTCRQRVVDRILEQRPTLLGVYLVPLLILDAQLDLQMGIGREKNRIML
jgi:hypothetical protein